MPGLQFDWDEQNSGHLARHEITPAEAEQVVINRPVDLELQFRKDEERTPQVGETDAGRILIVISTTRRKKVRVITAWPAKERFQRYFLSLKRNGNVGRRIEEQDLRK